MGFQYTYALKALTFFVVWMLLFILRKPNRKPMLIMSVIFAFVGPLVDTVYTLDWWKPETITQTMVGPEAILVGFMIGGIAAVIYEGVFKRKIKVRKTSKIRKQARNINFLLMIALAGALFFGSFYFLKLNSLIATIIALVIPAAIICIKRKDLIPDSLVTGVLLVGVAMLVYTAVELMTPGWVHAFWYFKNVPDIIILNVPIDDIIWYFVAGMFVGPLYEYWQEGKLVKQNNNSKNLKQA